MEIIQDSLSPWDIQPCLSTDFNLTQSLHTETNLRPVPGEIAMSPILNFLDHPFQTWQSSVLFAVALTCLILVCAFIGKRYIEALRMNSHHSSTNPLTLESLRPLPPPAETQNSATNVTGSEFRSRPRIQFNIPIVAVGEVHNSKIAQRRRASSGLGDHNTGGNATDISHQISTV